jgi:GTPase SAR1 family protein
MLESTARNITGFIMPVGNGAVGKTSLALTLEKKDLPPDWAMKLEQIKKSYNLEFRYVSDEIEYNGHTFKILQQFLVPPGQKSAELSEWGRNFDEIITIYRSIIRRVDVVLVSYSITDLDSYNDIEYWLEKVSSLIHDRSNLIIVGTHLDKSDHREVTIPDVEIGVDYVKNLMKGFRPSWKGLVRSMEVSNVSGENILRLKKLISASVILASGLPLN